MNYEKKILRKAGDTKALTFNFVLTLVSSLQKLANICKNYDLRKLLGIALRETDVQTNT